MRMFDKIQQIIVFFFSFFFGRGEGAGGGWGLLVAFIPVFWNVSIESFRFLDEDEYDSTCTRFSQY